VMEPTSSQRAAEPVAAAADPSTRAVVPGDGHQPDQKPHPDEYPLAGDNEQADPETPAERGPEPVDRSTQPPAAPAEATAYANADAGHDTADEPTRAPSDGKLARATLPTTWWSPCGAPTSSRVTAASGASCSCGSPPTRTARPARPPASSRRLCSHSPRDYRTETDAGRLAVGRQR
jgi:hypothetical protein